MLEKPKTVGDLRSLIADAIHDVRYGHLEVEKLAVMSDGFDAINNSLRTEIAAWALLVSVGQGGKQTLGALPLDASSLRPEIKN